MTPEQVKQLLDGVQVIGVCSLATTVLVFWILLWKITSGR